AVLKSIFSWALRKDLVATSPCAGLAATREHPRERVYSDAELRAVVEAVSDTELEELVPLILFTATRSEEARSARWEDMDLERRVWTIPDVKQGGTHVLPLSTGAMKVLAGIKRAEAPHVFPAAIRASYIGPGHGLGQGRRDETGASRPWLLSAAGHRRNGAAGDGWLRVDRVQHGAGVSMLALPANRRPA